MQADHSIARMETKAHLLERQAVGGNDRLALGSALLQNVHALNVVAGTNASGATNAERHVTVDTVTDVIDGGFLWSKETMVLEGGEKKELFSTEVHAGETATAHGMQIVITLPQLTSSSISPD